MQHHHDEESFYTTQPSEEILCHEQLRSLIRSKLEKTDETLPAKKEHVTHLLKAVIEQVLGISDPVESERIAATKRRNRA